MRPDLAKQAGSLWLLIYGTHSVHNVLCCSCQLRRGPIFAFTISDKLDRPRAELDCFAR